MNFEIIAGIILVVSFLIIIWLVLKKIPELKTLPPREYFLPIKKIKNNIKKKTILYWKSKVPNFYTFLQNVIYKIRDFIVKVDNKMLDWLLKLRKKTDEGKDELDDYWKDIKKGLKKKIPSKEKNISDKSNQFSALNNIENKNNDNLDKNIELDKELEELQSKIEKEESDKINLPPA